MMKSSTLSSLSGEEALDGGFDGLGVENVGNRDSKPRRGVGVMTGMSAILVGESRDLLRSPS